jgi:hypothetical protein
VCLQILKTRASLIHSTPYAANLLKKTPNGPKRNIFSIKRCTRTWVEAQGGPFKRQSENRIGHSSSRKPVYSYLFNIQVKVNHEHLGL